GHSLRYFVGAIWPEKDSFSASPLTEISGRKSLPSKRCGCGSQHSSPNFVTSLARSSASYLSGNWINLACSLINTSGVRLRILVPGSFIARPEGAARTKAGWAAWHAAAARMGCERRLVFYTSDRFRQCFELARGLAPAFVEAHLLVLLFRLFRPVTGDGAVFGFTVAEILERHFRDHERAGGFERRRVDRIRGDDALVGFEREDDAAVRIFPPSGEAMTKLKRPPGRKSVSVLLIVHGFGANHCCSSFASV